MDDISCTPLEILKLAANTTENLLPDKSKVSEILTSTNRYNVSKLESVDRIMNLPVVEFGRSYAERIYSRVKESNNIFHWTFGQAEVSLDYVVKSTTPAAVFFHGPLSAIDKILCQSLDSVEGKIPSIILPPEKIYGNTKSYIRDISNIIIHPILTKADSLKTIGNAVLESKYTTLAANSIEGALNVADQYVDIYFPEDVSEAEVDDKDSTNNDNHVTKAYQTIHHMDQLSRKLQRRLTRRTLAEAKALKYHSTEAIHVVAYVVELIANDPQLAHQKGLELWSALSKDEPENQARPGNLEELIGILTRESARRIVHFVNFTYTTINLLPNEIKRFTYKCMHRMDALVKAAHLDDINRTVIEGARVRAYKLTLFLHQLNLYTTNFLEYIASSLEQQDHNI